MSTSPLSDTFPGNLAGAASLWGPGQGGGEVVTGLGWGMGSLQLRPCSSCLCYSQARSGQNWPGDSSGILCPSPC